MPAVSETWTNWSGNQSQTRNVRVVQPHNLEQLRDEVRRAIQEGRKIRPVGTAHAWAELIANDGEPLLVVDLQRWKGDLAVDRADDTATMPAGWRLDEVTRKLENEGYQLSSPPVYEKMNMGGLLGTASHGTGDGMTETMSDHLVGFRMLTPDGNVVEIHKNDRLGERERELLRAVRCSMGALGIVFEVTLRVTPCYPVREHDFFIPVQEGLAKLDEIVDANMFVELFWVPFADNLWIKSYNRANPPGRFRPSSIWYWLRDGFMYWFQLLVYPGLLARRASMSEQWRTRTMLRWLTTLLAVMMGSRIVSANQAFHFQRTLPKVIALEIAVRREDFVDVCRYMMARIRDREVRDAYPTNIMLEARFISRSQETHGLETATELRDRFVPSILLSPAVFDETAYIELVGYAQTEGMLEFFREVERGVMAHWDEARPHWGKYFTLGAHLGSAPGTRTLAERYNENRRRSHWRMARFLRVREQLDPNHVMSNAFLEREVFLGGTRIPPSGDHLAHYLEDVRPCFAPPEGPHA